MNWFSPRINPDEEAIESAMQLDYDILQRELRIIEAQHKVNGQRAMREHILDWLARDKPAVFKSKPDLPNLNLDHEPL